MQRVRTGVIVRPECIITNTLFFKNEDLPNRYIRKQPTHFFIASFDQKLKKKKNFLDPTNQEFRTPRKMTFKSEAKTKPPFP